MRFARTLGLTLAAVMATLAFVVASSASATVLCEKEPENYAPAKCPTGWDVAVNGIITAKAFDPVLTTDIGDVTCEHSDAQTKVTNTGGANATVIGQVTALSFTGCEMESFGFSCTVQVLGLPYGDEAHWTQGTHDGVLTVGIPPELAHAKVTCGPGLINCEFGDTGLELKLIGGSPGALIAEEVFLFKLAGAGFICPKEVDWDAVYVMTGATSTIFVAKEMA